MDDNFSYFDSQTHTNYEPKKNERKMVELYSNSKRMEHKNGQNSPLEPTKKVFKLTLYLTRREATHKHKFIKKIKSF